MARDEGKTDRDPFANRYGGDPDDSVHSSGSQPSNETEESKPSKTPKMEETAETGEVAKPEPIRERTNVNMYLPDDLVTEVRLTHAELNAAWQRKHGEELEKNAEYYPALIRAGLCLVREELELDE